MDSRQRYVELVPEKGEKRTLTLDVGRDTGLWCLTAEGNLRPVAGANLEGARVFLRFDGSNLSLGTHPSGLLDLHPPAVLETGGLRISYRIGAPPRDLTDEDATEIRPPLSPRHREAPVARRAAGASDWDDATRVCPPPAELAEIVEQHRLEQLRAVTPSSPPPRDSPTPRPVFEGGRGLGNDKATVVVPPGGHGAHAGDGAHGDRPTGTPPPPARIDDKATVIAPPPVYTGNETVVGAPPRPPPSGDDTGAGPPRETVIGAPPRGAGAPMPMPMKRGPDKETLAAPPRTAAASPLPLPMPPPATGQLAPLAPPTAPAKAKGQVRITPIQIGILVLMVAVLGLLTLGVGTSRKKGPEGPEAKAVVPPRSAPSGSNAAAGGAPSGAAMRAPPAQTAALGALAGSAAPAEGPTPAGGPARLAQTNPLSAASAAQSSAGTGATSAASSASAGPVVPVVPAGEADERAAVLAVESGAMDRAAGMYDALATAHPERPAFREAARILRSKIPTR